MNTRPNHPKLGEQNHHDEGAPVVNRKLIRPSLTEVKDQMSRPQPVPAQPMQGGGGGMQPRRKPAPPDQTNAENFYYVKQMQSRTPVSVVLTDGEVLSGTVEWYDRDCIKLTRYGSPNLLIYKHCIKYLYKEGEEASKGGTNGQ
jgi:host factor-I protein